MLFGHGPGCRDLSLPQIFWTKHRSRFESPEHAGANAITGVCLDPGDVTDQRYRTSRSPQLVPAQKPSIRVGGALANTGQDVELCSAVTNWSLTSLFFFPPFAWIRCVPVASSARTASSPDPQATAEREPPRWTRATTKPARSARTPTPGSTGWGRTRAARAFLRMSRWRTMRSAA